MAQYFWLAAILKKRVYGSFREDIVLLFLLLYNKQDNFLLFFLRENELQDSLANLFRTAHNITENAHKPILNTRKSFYYAINVARYVLIEFRNIFMFMLDSIYTKCYTPTKITALNLSKLTIRFFLIIVL